MIYHLALYLKHHISGLNLVHYVSFRAMASLLTALVLSFVLGPWFIATSQAFFRSASRPHTPASHKVKDGMPTMGGLFILMVISITTLLWSNLRVGDVWIFLVCLMLFGLIGLWDDWSKIRYRKGISERTKFRAQVLSALCVISAWMVCSQPSTELCLPFFKNYAPDLGLLFIPWAIFLLVATSNAVNLMDGLDGLALTSLIPNFAMFSLVCYVAGHYAFASYLHVPFAGTAEIAILGSTLVGACLGFLWYNTYPAQIFMGDVGSLALGSGLALMALMAKQELLLALSGGLFVVETLSVIIQVISYKKWGRRIFKMAPVHHHFELLGWQESKITVRFGIISLILCLLALMTLKIR